MTNDQGAKMNSESDKKSEAVKSGSSLVIGHWSLVIAFYLLDVISKRWVVTHLEASPAVQVIPGWFNLVYVENTGAAFGSFKDSNTMFIAISAITLAGLLFFQWRGAFRDRCSKIGVSLLMAGILGNLTDRFLYKHVIDFLDFDLHVRFANPWPSFNVADSCICVAVILFVASSFLEEKEAAKAKR